MPIVVDDGDNLDDKRKALSVIFDEFFASK